MKTAADALLGIGGGNVQKVHQALSSHHLELSLDREKKTRHGASRDIEVKETPAVSVTV